MRQTPLTRVLALVLAAPLAMAPAAVLAQQDSASDASSGQSTSGSDGSSSSSSSSSSQSAGSQNGGTDSAGSADSSSSSQSGQGGDGSGQSDRLIAKVADTEIKTSDIEAAVTALPPQLRQQMPTEMLARMAVDQLVLRAMILEDAKSQNLGDDPEVQKMAEANQQRSKDDAIVQVYVQRALEGAVTDEKVQATYDEIASQSEEELPPLEAVRPQIEQQVRQQRLAEIRDELQQDVDVTYYGPDGEPQDASSSGSGGMSGSGSDSSSGSSDSSGSASSGSSSGSTSGSASDSPDASSGSTDGSDTSSN